MTKRCPQCQIEQDLEIGFGRRAGIYSHLFRSWCKSCTQAQRKSYKAAHPENEKRWYEARKRDGRSSLASLTWAKKYPDKKKELNSRYRAQKIDNTADKVDYFSILERDKYICQLCYTPVDVTLKWPHVDSLSYDHRVPLSRRGAHTEENIQVAHLRCNLSKGNRILS